MYLNLKLRLLNNLVRNLFYMKDFLSNTEEMTCCGVETTSALVNKSSATFCSNSSTLTVVTSFIKNYLAFTRLSEVGVLP